MDESSPTQKAQTRSKVAAYGFPYRVLPISTNPILEGGTYSRLPQGEVTNVEFLYSVNLLTQMVTTLSHWLVYISTRKNEARSENRQGKGVLIL